MGPSPTYHPPKGEECATSVAHELPLWAEPAVGYCAGRPRPSPMWGSRFVGAHAVGPWVGEQRPLGKTRWGATSVLSRPTYLPAVLRGALPNGAVLCCVVLCRAMLSCAALHPACCAKWCCGAGPPHHTQQARQPAIGTEHNACRIYKIHTSRADPASHTALHAEPRKHTPHAPKKNSRSTARAEPYRFRGR